MASILRVRQADGTVIDVPSIVGPAGPPGKNGANGQSAYQSAVSGGYTGTEDDLNRALALMTEFINGGGSAAGAHAASHAADGVDPITPDMIGAAEAAHTHTAADVGAAASNHTHTAAEVGAAASNHTHTAAEVGAAPAYTYGTEEIEAGSTSTEAEGTLHFVIE